MIDFPARKAANAPLNAFVDWDESVRGSDGPLSGLTVGVKSNIAVMGLPWTGGMALFRGRIAERDAEVVAQLRGAGAAIIGTLNMEEAALGSKTDNPWFGATHNPHRLGTTPGGSSGGSGAAVAAGLCDIALGTDTMGSVRIPAAHCGVYGFKPAHDAIGQDGLECAEPSLDTIGPLARDLVSLEQVSRLISRFGEGDNNAPGTIAAGAALLRMGGVTCQPDVVAAFARARAAVGALQSVTLTHELSRIRFAGFVKVSKYLAEALADADLALLSPHLRKLLTYGPARSDTDWAEDQQVLARTRADMRALVLRNGWLLLPTTPNAAFLLSEAEPANQADYTCLASIAGLPAISMPVGWTADGLPIGVQLVGQIGHEAGLFDLARAVDRALNAYRRPAHFYEGA
jgi:aspartyl-tRNA(Asn)/glutamyl-tRNA(Gln) amidotransferase subunit A